MAVTLPPAEVQNFSPIEALDTLSEGLKPEDPKYQDLELKLGKLPAFSRISETSLYKLTAQFPDTVNITGYSGQGVHPGQLKILEHAFPAIMNDMGWSKDSTLLISGGTALGIPDEAIKSLAKKHNYQAVGVMALPGVAYPMTEGYSYICADESWTSWGSETPAMAKGANGTLVAGGGTQALTDALLAVKDGEKVAVIANSFNSMARIPYRIGEKFGDVVIRADKVAADQDGIVSLADLYSVLQKQLKADGFSDADTSAAEVTGLPVSGLVTELKKGERRGCAQDLLYYAITGEKELLPAEFHDLTPESVAGMGIYYLLDDPSESLFGAAVLRINDALERGHTELLSRAIEHATLHDVHSPANGTFGPKVFGAKSSDELADILKAKLKERFS